MRPEEQVFLDWLKQQKSPLFDAADIEEWGCHYDDVGNQQAVSLLNVSMGVMVLLFRACKAGDWVSVRIITAAIESHSVNAMAEGIITQAERLIRARAEAYNSDRAWKDERVPLAPPDLYSVRSFIREADGEQLRVISQECVARSTELRGEQQRAMDILQQRLLNPNPIPLEPDTNDSISNLMQVYRVAGRYASIPQMGVLLNGLVLDEDDGDPG